MKTIIVLLTAILHLQRMFCKIYYYNYTLYRSIPVNDHQLNFFLNLSDKYDVNFWLKPGRLNKPVDIMISSIDKPSILREAVGLGIGLDTLLEDVQQAFDEQTVMPYIKTRTTSFDWRHYYRLHDIYNWLHDLSEAHPKSVTLMSLGNTSEEREIMAVTVDIGNWQQHPRPKVMIEGMAHAREWLSAAFVTFLIHKILSAPSSDNENLKRIAPLYEWNFVPVLNPDGYEYSHTKDRMWRKNRIHNHGVDLNRNFGYGFGGADVSFRPSSQIFCGSTSFSELETKAMANFVASKSSQLKYYFSFHSYGQFMILPYAFSTRHPENYDEMAYMSHKAADEVRRMFGTFYRVGTAYDTVGYTASGCSMDWVKNTYRVPYVVTFELPDKGRYGFALPPKHIQPACEGTMVAVLSLVDPENKVNRSTWKQGWKGWKARGPKEIDLDILLLCFSFVLIIVS